jgi:transposase
MPFPQLYNTSPKRWVVERSFGWMSRFRRLARDYERLAETLVGFHLIAFVILMVRQYVSIGFTSA